MKTKSSVSLTICALAVFLCCGFFGKQADISKSIDQIKKEVQGMSVSDLESRAKVYASAIKARKSDLEKIAAQIKAVAPKELFNGKAKGIKDCIFRKGKESLPGIGRNTAARARRERALSEASIATVKNVRFGFNKPRARSSETIILKGHAAILGANLAHLARDWAMATA